MEGNGKLRTREAFEPRLGLAIRMMVSLGSWMAGRGLFSHARLPGPWSTSVFMATLVLRVAALLVASPRSVIVIDNFSKSE